MRAGKYKERFVRLVPTKNGFKTEWQEVATYWGYRDGQEVRIRNRPLLTAQDRLRDKATGVVYEVETVDIGDDELLVTVK